MIVDIWRSATDATKAIAVQAGTDPTSFTYPATLPDALLTLQPFPSTRDLTSHPPLIGADSKKIIQDITRDGFSVLSAKIVVTVKA